MVLGEALLFNLRFAFWTTIPSPEWTLAAFIIKALLDVSHLKSESELNPLLPLICISPVLPTTWDTEPV